MTLAMPDSVTVANLPDGYPAYLGYADGIFTTAAELAARFPDAHRVILTVTGNTLDCDGIDCEPGNPDAASAAGWAGRKLDVAPGFRPVIYASVIGTPGYGMHDVLAHLFTLQIPVTKVRLLTAHYEWKSGVGADLVNRHICGPSTCGLLPVSADGTQWTDVWPGTAEVVDLSELRDNFFTTQPPSTGHQWTTEEIMQQLPVLAQGSTGTHVRTCQFQLREKGRNEVIIDGVYGPVTGAAVTAVQLDRHLMADGVVGSQTWPVLLGVA